MDDPNIINVANLVYALTLTSFTAATAVTLALHMIGSHGGCRRNMALSAFLGLLTVLSQNLKPFMSPSPTVQFLEALALLTILFAPLTLLLRELIELNNEAARVTRNTPKRRRIVSENQPADHGNISASSPATRQNRDEPMLSAAYSLQEMMPAQPPPASQTSVPPQKPTASPPYVSEDRRCFPSYTEMAKDAPGRGSTPAKPTKQSRKASGDGNVHDKSEPTIEDIIFSITYARLLEKLVIEILREGVRYKGKVHKIFLSFIRYQDMIYIWQLGKKNKPSLTERVIHRLLDLQLITVRKRVGETFVEVELTERGWAVRNAIAIAAQRILQKRAARIAVQAVR